MDSNSNILEIDNMKTYFYLKENKVAKAVDGVSLSIKQGETLALVGESGSGKKYDCFIDFETDQQTRKNCRGTICLNGDDLVSKSEKEMESIRGNQVAMVFQEPMTALNPVFTIGNQLVEMIRKHKKISKKYAYERAIELLKIVGIPRPDEIIYEYPHQLSGGMRQRVMIAIAISCEPKLLIADEPTTALDVTIQGQILDLLMDMKVKFNMSILLITHDLGVVAKYADEVAVMYGGQIVEQAPAKQLINEPKHPYTVGLMSSLPSIKNPQKRLETIEGIIPPAYDFPVGCRFSTRCSQVMERCIQASPNLYPVQDRQDVRCFLYEGGVANEDE